MSVKVGFPGSLLKRGRTVLSTAVVSGALMAGMAFAGAASADSVCGEHTYYDGLEAWNTGDETSAVSIWEFTANVGDVRSQLRLGQLYRDGAPGMLQNYVEAHKWFNLASNNTLIQCSGPLNNREARQARDDARDARDRLEDLMTYASISAAQDMLAKSYQCQRTADSLFRLGLIYHTGSGVPANKVSACSYYSIAAAEGVEEASIALEQLSAVMDKNEIDQCQNVARLFDRPSIAECGRVFGIGQCVGSASIATINRQAALRALGLYDDKLDGVTGPNTRAAVMRFQRTRGDAATGNLSEPQICALIEAAADKGDPNSILTLGYMYYEGVGFPKDDKQARYLFEQAANFGLASAAYNLGEMYIKGHGVGRDFVKGCNYLKTANAKGHPGADKSLSEYCPKGNY